MCRSCLLAVDLSFTIRQLSNVTIPMSDVSLTQPFVFVGQLVL